MRASEIIDAARVYLGTPFHHQGRVLGHGVDCAGLIVCVARDLGLSPFDLINYDHDPSPIVLRDLLNGQLDPVSSKEMRPPDIVLIQFPRHRHGYATHLGILTDIGIIHAYAPARKVVETALDNELRAGVMGAYRWPF